MRAGSEELRLMEELVGEEAHRLLYVSTQQGGVLTTGQRAHEGLIGVASVDVTGRVIRKGKDVGAASALEFVERVESVAMSEGGQRRMKLVRAGLVNWMDSEIGVEVEN